MKDSKKILSEHKVSITNPRILVLEALLDNKNPLTIDELQSKLKNKVAKSTLYRVLNDLKNINSKDIIYMSKDSDLFDNMFYYKTLILNAKQIHCINSSFLHLVERIKTDSHLYYHNVRNSNFKLSDKWNVVNYDN